MKLHIEPYRDQVQRWPTVGRHILAQFDEHSIIVYQAYRPAIGHFAAKHGYFGGEFSFTRMSWIKPNFLWMMYRSGWGTKDGQEVTLAVRLKRAAFDSMLEQAVYSSFAPHMYATEAAWSQAVAQSSVRLQWDPDHDPGGNKSARRAIQLGLRGDILRQYAQDWIIDIEDISPFVGEQRVNAHAGSRYEHLQTPCEEVYPIADPKVATKLGIATP
ncbi:MAG: DUF4291 domain-containing protein [Chloroflexota bacterium]|nr:DUF4291 domain-containing protein [Chloroflexota bacterium]